MSLIRGQGIRFKDEMVICTDNWDFTGAFFFSGTVVTTIGKFFNIIFFVVQNFNIALNKVDFIGAISFS